MDWTPVIAWLASHGVRILIILLIGVALYYAVQKLIPTTVGHTVQKRMERQAEEEVDKRTKTLSRVFVGAAVAFIVTATAFMVLSEVGIDIAPLIAGFGIVGIAIGFGAQNLVRDIFAGLFVLLENQYCVGDWVRIADIAGTVEEINLRRTVLRDLDGTVHVVPNGAIRVASNFTREWSRVNLNISVAYGTDLNHAIAVINRVVEEMAHEPHWRELILKAPRALRVDNLGDSGIDIKILGDTKPVRQWEVMGELRKRLKEAFDEEGIEIPWPHTKVYFGDASQPRAHTEESAPTIPPSEVVPPDEAEAE